MRLPLEIAMEVGSFLDQPSLTVCTTQLCRNGVLFVSRPCKDSAKVPTIQLHKLVNICQTASRTLGAVGQVQTNGLTTDAIKRIDLCLVRRPSAEKVIFVFDLRWTEARENTEFNSTIHRHYSLSSNLQFNNGPNLAVEWHAFADSVDAVTFLLEERNGGGLNDGCALASCQPLHALDLMYTTFDDISALAACQSLHTLVLSNSEVSDVSALASCPALHTLRLDHSQVSDVSALASCQSLHTLTLERTDVSDVSALASCQALHTLNLESTDVSDVFALASCQALHTLDLGGTQVSDVSALASCQALHTLDLSFTKVSDVSALASCQALHTLNLGDTKVSDVSALASCPALHTLTIYYAPVSDVSALAACGSLRYVHGCERIQKMFGYGALARLLENRRLRAQGV
jgi:hypothetical protein